MEEDANHSATGQNMLEQQSSMSSSEAGEDSSTVQWTKTSKIKRTVESMILKTTMKELKYRQAWVDVDLYEDCSQDLTCTRCNADFLNIVSEGQAVHSHPLLKVLYCESCCNFYGNGEFSMDEDGEDKYCRWCGEGGTLFLCSKCICGFCPGCIEKHFGKQKMEEVQADDDWVCYICKPKPLWLLRNICALATKRSHFEKRKKLEKNKGKLLQMKLNKEFKKIRKPSESSSSDDNISQSSGQSMRKRKLVIDESDDESQSKIIKPSEEGAEDTVRPPSAPVASEAVHQESMHEKSNIPADIENEGVSDNMIPTTSFSLESVPQVESETLKTVEELPPPVGTDMEKFKQAHGNCVADLKMVFKLVEDVSNLCGLVCKKRILKISDTNYINSPTTLLKEFDIVDSAMDEIALNINAISSAVNVMRKFVTKEFNLTENSKKP